MNIAHVRLQFVENIYPLWMFNEIKHCVYLISKPLWFMFHHSASFTLFPITTFPPTHTHTHMEFHKYLHRHVSFQLVHQDNSCLIFISLKYLSAIMEISVRNVKANQKRLWRNKFWHRVLDFSNVSLHVAFPLVSYLFTGAIGWKHLPSFCAWNKLQE